MELPVGDLGLLGRGVVHEVLERGAVERRRGGRLLAERETVCLAPAPPSLVLRVARASAVVFVPLARAAAGEDVAADAVAPALLGVGDEVEHPLSRALPPVGHDARVGDVGEGVEMELVRCPIGRVEVDHHHEARVRARLHEVFRLRVERGPVVFLETLPDERVFAIRFTERVDRVRCEEASVRDAHRGELAGALQLLVEAAVRYPQLLPALRVKPRRDGTRRGGTHGRCHHGKKHSHHTYPFSRTRRQISSATPAAL